MLLPFANTKIPDPDFPQNSDLFYKQAPRALVGLASESRINDANSGMFHVEVGAGPFTVAQTDGAGEQIFGQSAYPLEATRPAKPDARPVDRPNVPCETQLPPDLHAPTQKASSGLIDLTSQTPLASTSAMAPDIAKLHENGLLIAQRLQTVQQRQAKGLPIVDPLVNPDFKQQDQLAKTLGLKWDGPNLLDLRTAK